MVADDDKAETAKLRISCSDDTRRSLAARISELKRRDRHVVMDANVQAIQSLRGTAARASFILPAFYHVLGATSQRGTAHLEHWQVVQGVALEQAGLHTIALTCRAVFDERSKRLGGRTIASLHPRELQSVATYWAGRSGCSLEDARTALALLKGLFERCARPAKTLLDQPSLLEKRIGLIKHYANRDAAHLSLEEYLFDTLDLLHVVASIVLVGAIIAEFDDPERSQTYFDEVDEGAWQAAKAVFPSLAVERLFKRWDIREQGRLLWRAGRIDGVEYLLDQLPAALGYWESPET